MKTISSIVFMLLIFSCGGNVTTDYNGINIETKSNFSDYKDKSIIIYSNISQSAIQQFRNTIRVSDKYVKSFSNKLKCKDINSNYIQYQKTNSYTHNDFIACLNYDMSKTKYSGNKTYIIIVGYLDQNAIGGDTLDYSSDFERLFTKPRIPLPSVFKDKYDISEIKSNNNYVMIYRNANNKVFLEILKPRKDTFIYKLPPNETITCEKLGFSYKEGSDDSLWRQYEIKYTENNETKYKTCLDYPMLESYTGYYGSDTYISVTHYE